MVVALTAITESRNAQRMVNGVTLQKLCHYSLQSGEYKMNIIHRDLKLNNIFIDEKMEVKIEDFGLATELEYKN